MLNSLYYNYRSDQYNKERSYYEPGYEKIMELVGKNEAELKFRQDNLNTIITNNIQLADIKKVLDFGGGDGSYIPESLRKKHVTIVDVSNEELVDKSYKTIKKLDDNDIFDYVQICHVLEHVMDPYLLVNELLSHLKTGGYLYIEVPQDRSNEYLEGILHNSSFHPHFIQEHINLYSETAVAALGKALSIEQIYISKKIGHLGWMDMEIISALFKKN
jgi:2-polyprenyl-3-methyl-5-hydroxy-6-metoxy-1,4-benzoquinol methylase